MLVVRVVLVMVRRMVPLVVPLARVVWALV